MKKLIEIIDYIIEQHEQCISSTSKTYNYAIFLKQPLELWMFVPCDEDGNVLEKPDCSLGKDCASPPCVRYQKAKERCLFKGFEMYKGNPYNYNKARAFTQDYIDEKWIIEKIIHWDLELTESAIKQSGL